MNTTSDETIFAWLESVRKSGVINMYAVGPWLRETFDLDKNEAQAVWLRWTESFKSGVSRPTEERKAE